jgi:hypothetical protein
MDLMEEVEFLLHRLAVLHEVEDLASQGKPEMLPELRKLYRSTFRQLHTLVRRLFKVRPSLGARGPGASIELLERLFLKLREQAEVEGARAAKFRGVKAKRPKAEAKEIQQMTRLAARALKAVAKRLGRWDDAYATEHGLNDWL